MTTEEPALLEFPCHFAVKALGRNSLDFKALVTEIILRHASLFDGEDVTTNPSAEGNFLSVTVPIVAQSRKQLNRIYQDLTDCDRILMAL